MPDHHSRIKEPIRRSSYQRPHAGSPGFTRPRNRVRDILLCDSELREPGTYFIGTAPLQWAQDDALPIRTYIEVFNSGETRDHCLWKGDLILGGLFSQHDSLIQGNKEILLRHGSPRPRQGAAVGLRWLGAGGNHAAYAKIAPHPWRDSLSIGAI
jgi:hypothetical protein